MALSFMFSSHNPSAGLFLSMEQGNETFSTNDEEASTQINDCLFSNDSLDSGFDTFISSNSAETIGNVAYAGAGVETAGSAAFAGGGFEGAGAASSGGSCGGDSGGFIC